MTPYGTVNLAVGGDLRDRFTKVREQLLYVGEAEVNQLLAVHGAEHVRFVTKQGHAVLTNDAVLHVALSLLEHHLRGLNGRG